MNTENMISSFYKNANLDEVSKEVIKAFELIVRADERNKMGETKRCVTTSKT